MILVDTSVWINHFQRSIPDLEHQLLEGQVLVHPFILGELSVGYLPKRNEVLPLLKLQLRITQANDEEVLGWVEKHRLFGRGIGWVDAHLLLSCLLSGSEFWTHDKPLLTVAQHNAVKVYSRH